MRQLTQKEFDQRALMEMRFKHYYKYTFVYEGDYYDGRKVIVLLNCADDIYRTELADVERLGSFELEEAFWSR